MSCPVCGKPASVRYRPFCSRRCSEIDLGKWIAGAYVLPETGTGSDEDDLDHPSPKPDRAH